MRWAVVRSAGETVAKVDARVQGIRMMQWCGSRYGGASWDGFGKAKVWSKHLYSAPDEEKCRTASFDSMEIDGAAKRRRSELYKAVNEYKLHTHGAFFSTLFVVDVRASVPSM